MGLDTNLFSIITNPVEKLVKDASQNIVDTAENAVVGELSGVFQRIGLGSGSNKSILGNLGEQVLAGIAGEIFGAIGREMNISSKSDIESYRHVLTEADSRDRDEIMASQVTKIGGKTVKTHTFPPDLNDFYVQMDFKEYRRPAPSVPATADTVFSIALPLPRTLEDRHDINYNSATEIGFLGAVMNQGQNGAASAGGWDGVSLAYAGKEALKAIVGSDNTTVFDLISQQVGAVFNNHVSAMFEQPSLRKHNMSWLLAPNNAAESETIRQITKLLKGASLPAFSRETNGNANLNILTFPMMCKITLFPWGDVAALSRLSGDTEKAYNGNMYTFKHCVVESIKVNYAPSSPSFFADGENAPAFIGIEMSFLEIEYFTADDFGRAGRNADFGKALWDGVENIFGQKWEELSEEEKKKFVDEQIQRNIDGRAGATPAQADVTNNFSANSTVVREYSTDNSDGKSTQKIYQTADGSWYALDSIGGRDRITPIESLTDPIFSKFDIYDQSISEVPTTPLTWGDTTNKKILTGVGGNLVLGGG